MPALDTEHMSRTTEFTHPTAVADSLKWVLEAGNESDINAFANKYLTALNRLQRSGWSHLFTGYIYEDIANVEKLCERRLRSDLVSALRDRLIRHFRQQLRFRLTSWSRSKRQNRASFDAMASVAVRFKDQVFADWVIETFLGWEPYTKSEVLANSKSHLLLVRLATTSSPEMTQRALAQAERNIFGATFSAEELFEIDSLAALTGWKVYRDAIQARAKAIDPHHVDFATFARSVNELSELDQISNDGPMGELLQRIVNAQDWSELSSHAVLDGVDPVFFKRVFDRSSKTLEDLSWSSTVEVGIRHCPTVEALATVVSDAPTSWTHKFFRAAAHYCDPEALELAEQQNPEFAEAMDSWRGTLSLRDRSEVKHQLDQIAGRKMFAEEEALIEIGAATELMDTSTKIGFLAGLDVIGANFAINSQPRTLRPS